MRHLATHLGLSSLFALALAVAPATATATLITFDPQASGHGGNLTGIPDSPLIIGIATFTGGELLNAEVGLNADQTGVLASQGLFGSGETNPLTITFASPVSDLSVFVVNGDDVRSYTVADNLGRSMTMSLSSAGASGSATFSLPGPGVTSVDITSANADAWDFAIDDVTFDAATTTPEPESWLLLGFGLVFLATLCRKKRAALRAEDAARAEP